DQYKQSVDAVRDVDATIAREIDDPQLARDFQTFVNMQTIAANRGYEAMLHSAATQTPYFPQAWTAPAQCEDVSTCPIYQKMQEGSSESARNEKTYTDN